MAEWQEFSSPAVGAASDGRAPALPPPIPTMDDLGNLVLELGEAGIGSLPASGVRFRTRHGTVDQRWGPLEMRITLTTQRIVLVAMPGTPADPSWSTPGTVPFALRAIEPPQALRALTPVRIVGHVRWNRVTRVEVDDRRIFVTMPAPLAREATLALQVPSQLSRRFLAIARAAFVAARRPLSADTTSRVEAPATM